MLWQAVGTGTPWVAYQRPSSPSWTTSTTSPLLTASMLGPPLSWSTTAVYLPGAWSGGHRAQAHKESTALGPWGTAVLSASSPSPTEWASHVQ